MNPQQALLAALAALSQQISGLGNAVTLASVADPDVIYFLEQINTNTMVVADHIEETGKATDRVTAELQHLSQLMSLVEQHTNSAKPGGAGGQAKKNKDEGGGVGDVLKGVFSLALNKITLILAPMLGLAAVVSSVTSGFQPLLASMRVFAAVLGAFLLPVTTVLAAAILAAAVVLEQDLQPQLQAWIEAVMGAIPAVVEFASWVVAAVKALVSFVGWLGGVLKGRDDYKKGFDSFIRGGANLAEGKEWNAPREPGRPETPADAVPGFLRPLMQELGRRAGGNTYFDAAQRGIGGGESGGGGGFFDAARRGTGGGGSGGYLDAARRVSPPVDGGKKTIAGEFPKALNDVITSLKMQLGPPQSMGSIADYQKRVQQAVLTKDPIQDRLDQLGLRVVSLLEQVAAKVGGRPKGIFDAKE